MNFFYFLIVYSLSFSKISISRSKWGIAFFRSRSSIQRFNLLGKLAPYCVAVEMPADVLLSIECRCVNILPNRGKIATERLKRKSQPDRLTHSHWLSSIRLSFASHHSFALLCPLLLIRLPAFYHIIPSEKYISLYLCSSVFNVGKQNLRLSL